MRPYNGGGGETGFGEGDGEAAVADVVRGLQSAFGGECEETVNQAFFGDEVNGGWVAGDDARDRLRVFGGREFAVGAEEGRRMLRPYRGIRSVEEEDHLALVPEGDF